MIRKLKKRLTLIFICSIMSVFTLVFCLFINENIQSKKEEEMNFLGRMTTYLVFQLENSSNLDQDLTLAGQTYDFTLLLKNQNGSFVPITTTIPDSDMNTLITSFEQELKKVSINYTDNTHNSQSGTFSFSTPDTRSFYGIQVKVITQNSDSIELYVIKEAY